MFSNKMNNSGWILCPSKRFPGKFYYYNVLNGESAWSFNDTEKKFLRIDDKTKLITQKWHCYPEPVSPPGKSMNCSSRSNSLFPQKFGQATFQNYFSPGCIKQPTPNVLKKPIFDIQDIRKSKVPKKNVDIQTDLPDTEIMVQYCKEPLSKRFWKYQNYDMDNKAPLTKINWLPGVIDNAEHNLDSANENYLESNNIFTNTKIESKIEQSAEYHCKNLFLMNQKPVQNITNSLNTFSTSKVELADNDLRYILQAKRCDKNTEEPQKNTKKKVRFDLTSHVNDNNDETDLKNDMAIRDTLNSTTAKIMKHVMFNTERGVDFIDNQQNEDDDLRNIKFVVKNSNPKSLFQQNKREINPFQLKNEKVSVMGNVLRKQNVEDSLNVSNEQHQYPSTVPGNNEIEILNQDVLNVTEGIKEKLYVRGPNKKQFGSKSKVIFLKSSPLENPFKEYKSKINPYLKYRSAPQLKRGCSYLFTSNESVGNNFKPLNINSLEHKNMSSGGGVNYFDSKLYNYRTTNYNNNSISISDCTNDQSNFQYSNTNAEVTDRCMTFCEPNMSGKGNSWLEDRLKKFYSRNSYIEKSVILRMDEIICWFTQITENVIHDILETSTSPPPYSLYDAILCLQRRFNDHRHILQVVDKITDLDIFSSKTGYLKDKVCPYELIKALGCGIIFIEALNEFQAFDVKDAESALLLLLRDIEEPQYVELPQPTTTVSRDSTEQPDRVNFVKRRSDILTYLQKHFPEWQNYHEEEDQVPTTKTKPNVVVTTGKDLHLFKINYKNEMYCEPEGQKETIDSGCDNNKCNKAIKVTRKFSVIEKFENRINEINTEVISSNRLEVSKRVTETIHTKNEETLDKDICEENNYSCNKEPTQMDNYNEQNKNSDDSVEFIETENDVNKTKPVSSPHMDNSTRINESSTITDDFPVLNNDPVTHYYMDDANQYYLFVKNFLTELSNMLILIHTFIKDNVDRFHDTEMSEADKRELHVEANQTYDNLKNIISELKSIIERETRDENALRIMLIGADEALQDKRITNYRQVVSKCLEQARHLASCLRLLLRIADRDCTLSASSDAGATTCINIFE